MQSESAKIYVVLGMHKSGTTLLAQMLHFSGINMIDDEIGSASVYDRKVVDQKTKESTAKHPKNVSHFFERKLANDLNQSILIDAGAKKTIRGNVSSLYIPNANSLKLSTRNQEGIKRVIEICNQNYPQWGFKDPRTCLTYPLWNQHLPDHKIIVIYRHFLEILHHKNVLGLQQWNLVRLRKVLHSWMYYNQQIVNALKTTTRPYIVINYRNFVTDVHELDRLSAFVGQNLVDNRKLKLYRSKIDRTQLTWLEKLIVLGLAGDPFAILEQLDGYALHDGRGT